METRPHRLAYAIIVGCFSVATLFHLADMVQFGWLPYRFAPLPMNLFWTSLTLLDPAVALALLARRRRLGLSLALAVMVVDVAANGYALHGLGYPQFAVALQLQTGFLGFLLGSIAFLWPASRGSASALRSPDT